jgi:hypothetical protein
VYSFPKNFLKARTLEKWELNTEEYATLKWIFRNVDGMGQRGPDYSNSGHGQMDAS